MEYIIPKEAVLVVVERRRGNVIAVVWVLQSPYLLPVLLRFGPVASLLPLEGFCSYLSAVRAGGYPDCVYPVTTGVVWVYV